MLKSKGSKYEKKENAIFQGSKIHIGKFNAFSNLNYDDTNNLPYNLELSN